MGFTDSVRGIAHEKRIYEETLTKAEFMNVTNGWIEERKSRSALSYPNRFQSKLLVDHLKTTKGSLC
jgi:hypothetical protein